MLDDSLSRLFSAASFPRLILGGDFNCGGIDWSCDHQYGHSLNACEQALLEVSDKCGLSQHVHSPTRPSSGRLLDLVFASHPTVIQACHVVHGISDHDAVLFEINMSPKCPLKPPRKILQYHKGDFDGLRSHLSSFATTYLESDPVNRSVVENWNIIAEGIKEAIDNYIPHKMSKAKHHLPWVSPAI